MIHLHAPVVGYGGDGRCGEIFLRRESNKFIYIGRRYYDGHPLLRFGNGELRARKALVLFGDFVELDYKPVGKLADGYGYAAGAEVVALLYEAGGLLVEEEALKLSFGEGVALLNLGAAGLNGLLIVRLG